MKKLLFSFFILPFLLSAQGAADSPTTAKEYLHVRYEGYYKFDPSQIRVRGGRFSSPDFQKMIKDEMRKPTFYNLTLDRNESLWSAEERVSNDQSSGFRFRGMRGGNSYVYKNYEEGLYYNKKNVFTKEFIVRDSLTKLKWNLTREKKEILGYEVRKATAALTDSTEVEAWYAPKLNYDNGPDRFAGLPGLILELRMPQRRGEQEYFAILIKVTDEPQEFKKPSGEEVITEEEYEKKQVEMREKFREMYGGGVSTDE